eukprot:comp6743_c0_seq1/m.2520 comp6743_c0_seq1/g.2520  ORF comp6743_c0_seq1/g.2520 comp6743_c0_seq1/m.2520 type:complete len:318 (-) comp6743_c0_seq1:450-1403(-)
MGPSTGSTKLQAWEAALCGSLAGLLARLVTSPLDVIKIRLQLQLEPIKKKRGEAGLYRGWRHALLKIMKDEGVVGLFKGNLTADLLYLSYGAVQFACYNEWKTRMGPMTPTLGLIGGGLSGTLATVVTYPLDILRTRLAAQGEPRVYHNLRGAISHMYKHEGLVGFYKGLGPTVLQILPYMSLQFAFYEASIRAAKAAHAVAKNIPLEHVVLGSGDVVMCGAIAGALSKTVVLPLDCIRKRLQVVGFESARQQFGRTEHYQGTVHCVRTVWVQEGLQGFYKGGVPATLKALVASAVTFGVYDRCARLRRSMHDPAPR